jgi:hypothetical protein
MDDKKNQKT